MKNKPDSESGFLGPRVFAGFTFCLAGISLALLSFASGPAGKTTRTAVYLSGNTAAPTSPNDPAAPSDLGFSTPVQMIRPLSPAFFQQGGEPEIKVDLFGNIYLTAIQGTPGGVDLWKSTDKGATFVYLGEPDGAQDKCPSIPQCAGFGGGDDAIDVSSGGYLYVSSLFGVQTTLSITMSVSMDGGTGGVEAGQAWTVNPASAGIPVNDRQWVAAYGPQTLYMTFDQAPANTGVWFTKSTDAGKTFSPPKMLTAVGSISRANNLVVDQYNGNLYTTYCPVSTTNRVNLLKSTDGGTTWTDTPIYTGPAGTSVQNAFPTLAVDRGGNVHLVFTQSSGPVTARTNAHVFLMSSADQGATWTAPVRVDSGTNTQSTVMPYIVAGSPGVVDITWYGSSSSSPDAAPFDWHVFFAQTTNAFAATPTFTQVLASPAQVHDAAICSAGGGCAAGTRDLLEYYSMTLDNDGNANIAFVDGMNNCPAASCKSNAWYTKQVGGQSAFMPPAPPAPATFSNLTLPGSTNAAEPSLTVDSHNCIYGASNGAPYFWASETNGLTFRNTTVPPALGGGDSELATIPKADGSLNDSLYYTDLVLADVDIFKSIDRGVTWAGTTEAYGHLNASSDRQWIKGERIGTGGANQVLYEMDHELASEDIRFAASINDSAWSPPASGITEPEMILPPNSTFPNTNPGPVFIDKTTHMVYGVFTASTIKTNRDRPPFGKLPNVWAAFGPGTTTAGVPPGPFVNRAAFRGVFDSPTNPAPPAGSQTFGSNAANDFPSATIDNAGNIYVVWATQNARTNQMSVWFSSSHDHGQNFYGPFEVAKFPAPPAGSAEMPWIAAGDKGRIAIVYYQTNEAGDPNSTNLHWNTMFAQSLNADSREPVFTISQVSDHVMHFGPICNLGLLCASGTRELLDFFSVAIGPDGLANINFADTGNANSPSHVTYARQLSGPLSLTNPTFPTCTGAANAPPVAVLTATPTSGPAPLTVTFDGSGSFDQDLSDTIVRYTFDFGDGTPVVTQGAPMVQHTYANPGTFTATLVVTDSRGVRSQNTAQQVITVTPGGNSSPTPTATATATASPTATATATASPTPTATATASPTPTSTATASATATATATASPTPTATATASPIPTATATASPTPTATATASPSATATATASPTATPSATPTATPVDVELLNISGRVFTKTGDKVGIGGFIISGTGTKRIMARAIGPSLSVNGKLQDPFLEIHDSNGSEPLTNDNWRSSQEAEIQQTGLAPTDDRESAVVKRLPAGNYTAIIRGADGGQGIGVVELYDLSGTDPGELGNLSVRADVGTGDNVLFNGLILRGGNAKRVLFRALGPSVKVNGSTVPGALPDPVLELHDGNGGLMATNDNWKDAPNAAQIQATGLAPPDDHESAILMTLSNGNVTTIVRGVGNTTGIALAEAYKLD